MSGPRVERRASWTAQVTAAQRAAETLQPQDRRLLEDPYARYFVDHPALKAALTHPLAARGFTRALDRLGGKGFHAFIVLRVRYADDACAAAIDAGIGQLVLLGAGFDTTSLRRAAAPITVFEVDAPVTQQQKRAVYERCAPSRLSDRTVWVPCDFERDELGERLAHHAFDSTRPTVVVWIGVSQYLTRQAINTTLSDISVLCAPGSRLVFEYIDASVFSESSRWKGARRIARAAALRGEPFRTGFTQNAVETLLATHGFQCRDHVRVPELLRRYSPTWPTGRAFSGWQVITTAHRS